MPPTPPQKRNTPWFRLGVSLVILTAMLVSLVGISVRAATPADGTVSDTQPTLEYTGGPGLVSNGGDCTLTPCDDFTLTVAVPAGFEATNNLSIRIESSASADFDLAILDADTNAPVTSSGASPGQPEVVLLSGKAARYIIRVVPFAVTPLDTYTGKVSLVAKPIQPPPSTEPAAGYQVFDVRDRTNPDEMLGDQNNAGEPSIGANWSSGKILYQSYLETYRVTFDDTTTPTTAKWENKSPTTSSLTSLDPILFTDPRTGRTLVSQLSAKSSLSSFTDDDGEGYTPSSGNSPLISGVDHQTYGGGPYAPGTPVGPLTAYPHNVYYCSQDIAEANCARSDDGGLTFNPAIPMYAINDCNGLHGHVKVSPPANEAQPDTTGKFVGTVYVPNKGCNGQQAVAVSENNGLTWSVRRVPGSTAGAVDPSVGIGANGTVYIGYANGDGHPRAAVSRDQGRTWTDDQDIGAQFNIQSAVWPVAVAGDDDRAAIAFIGTPNEGDPEQFAEDDRLDPTKNFQGEWHLYIAHTYDGGKSWVTTDATPTDPVQRGSICNSGTTCGSNRNLLDFIDITVDRDGRALVGYADGCIDECAARATVPNQKFDALASIARQTTGKRLFAAADPPIPEITTTPTTGATTAATTVPTTGATTGATPTATPTATTRPTTAATTTATTAATTVSTTSATATTTSTPRVFTTTTATTVPTTGATTNPNTLRLFLPFVSR